MTTPKEPGIYLVTPTNSEPISVNADRPRIADRCIKVTSANCKVGKAKNLAVRERNYRKTFGADNVVFEVLAVVQEPERFEPHILRRLTPHRIRGEAGRLNEWLQGVSPDAVREIVQDVLASTHSRVNANVRPEIRPSRSRSGNREPAADPGETVRLLRQFTDLGFSDAHFGQVHHFWPTKAEKIENHLKYCEKAQRFHAHSNNAITQRRLSFVIDRVEEVRATGRLVDNTVFADLAREASKLFPAERSDDPQKPA